MGRTAIGVFASTLLCCYPGGQIEARVHLLGATEQIMAPRFAEGDLGGDGKNELVIGGRRGPFRAVTDDYLTKTAGIEIYRSRVGILEPAASSNNLHVINDVAVGDLDGDGRAEIIAAGDHRVHVVQFHAGQLSVLHSEVLATGTLRALDCIDLDRDGRAEMVVAESRPETGTETLAADIRIYSFTDQLTFQSPMPLSQNAGDLCLADLDNDGSDELIVEEGTEEVGGTLSVFGFSGMQPYERFRQAVTSEHIRVLSLSVARSGNATLLGAGDVRGKVTLLQLQGQRLAIVDRIRPPAGSGVLHAMHLTSFLDLPQPQVILGTAVGGMGGAQLWQMAVPGF